jgi:hypothetical protein
MLSFPLPHLIKLTEEALACCGKHHKQKVIDSLCSKLVEEA